MDELCGHNLKKWFQKEPKLLYDQISWFPQYRHLTYSIFSFFCAKTVLSKSFTFNFAKIKNSKKSHAITPKLNLISLISIFMITLIMPLK